MQPLDRLASPAPVMARPAPATARPAPAPKSTLPFISQILVTRDPVRINQMLDFLTNFTTHNISAAHPHVRNERLNIMTTLRQVITDPLDLAHILTVFMCLIPGALEAAINDEQFPLQPLYQPSVRTVAKFYGDQLAYAQLNTPDIILDRLARAVDTGQVPPDVTQAIEAQTLYFTPTQDTRHFHRREAKAKTSGIGIAEDEDDDAASARLMQQ